MPQFARIPSSVWQLRGSMRALASPGYARIVQRIAKEASVTDHRREKASSKRGYFRARVILSCSAGAISLFHNASTGYRAQYYSSVACGEHANAFTLRLLVPRVRKLLDGCAKRTCPWRWIESSLLDPAAKVWIHQGSWLRYARGKDRNLEVPRWLAAQTSRNRKRRRKARWSTLTPRNERHLELIGGFLSLDGTSLGSLKPTRSRDLYELGFT